MSKASLGEVMLIALSVGITSLTCKAQIPASADGTPFAIYDTAAASALDRLLSDIEDEKNGPTLEAPGQPATIALPESDPRGNEVEAYADRFWNGRTTDLQAALGRFESSGRLVSRFFPANTCRHSSLPSFWLKAEPTRWRFHRKLPADFGKSFPIQPHAMS